MWAESRSGQRGLATLITAAIASLLAAMEVPAAQRSACDPLVAAKLNLDQGHRWRPPFGLHRVGSPFIAHLEIASERTSQEDYYLVAGRGSQQLSRLKFELSTNPGDYVGLSRFLADAEVGKRFGHLQVPPEATEAIIERECSGRIEVVARGRVAPPAFAADAVAHPQNPTNPVDLGAILPPYDGLLMQVGESATVSVAALSNTIDLPSARLTAWFEGNKKIEKTLALPKGRRITTSVKVPLSAAAQSTTLHIRLFDRQGRAHFAKDIGVMVARPPDNPWPAFGAVETKLRYDAPIPSFDPRTGAARSPASYESAWDKRLKDVVVFLPNGSRFVFWRGASYVPFWAGRHNTGTLYQWVENCNKELHVTHPDGSWDCPEPIFDSELRYGRVRIVESTTSRVHVRWEYQLTDINYEIQGGAAREDFYFYPDGFGTRVVTFVAPPEADPPQLSEFLVVTPSAAYPFQVLPGHPIEVINLESGQKDRIAFPYQESRQTDAGDPQVRFSRLQKSGKLPALYRVYSHKDDRASAIYLHFEGGTDLPVLAPYAFPPMYERGEIVTPAYWGNHWPLTRGKWTGWTINDQVGAGPSHNSLAVWIPLDPDSGKLRFEMAPVQQSRWEMPGCAARKRLCTLNKFVWMIGNTELPDRDVIEIATSFLGVPDIQVVRGGHPAIPAYIPGRRALRVIAESPSLDLELNSEAAIVAPVIEIEGAPKELTSVALDGQVVSPKSYRWDGSTLWIGEKIPSGKRKLAIQFRGEETTSLTRAEAPQRH